MAIRTVLAVVVIVLFLATDFASAQIFIPPPASSGYARPTPYGYFTPPHARSDHRTKPASVRIPEPEKATISEEYAKGSIVIVNHERRLYFVEDVGRATRYPVAIGKLDDQWDGVETVTAKRENPTWYPPEEIQLEMDVPPVVPPGSQNPLGPRALYLGDTLYRIHGTNRPGSIGGAVSHGCFRMHNPHIVELFDKVQIGANVYVVP
jgi:lipoprotein-anchoring transpeptidase ErfK/SrfK